MDDILVLSLPIIAVAGGLAIPIIGIFVDHFTKKAKMRLMEKAIEKGLTLEGLSLEEKKRPRMPYRSGMISLAIGIGVAIFAVLVSYIEAKALYPLLGGGAILVLIGIASILNDRINYDRYFNRASDPR